MSRKKLQNPKRDSDSKTVTVSWRLPKFIVDGLEVHADNRMRSVAGQAAIALADWLRTHNPTMPEPALTLGPASTSQMTVQAPSGPSGIRPATITTKPQPNVQAIIDDEKGWEHGQ